MSTLVSLLGRGELESSTSAGRFVPALRDDGARLFSHIGFSAYLGSIALGALEFTTYFQQRSEDLSSVICACGTGALAFQISTRDNMSMLSPRVCAIFPPLKSIACSPSPSLQFTLTFRAHAE